MLITHEMADVSPGLVRELQALLGGVRLEPVSHTVRTGETVPYANVVVVSG